MPAHSSNHIVARLGSSDMLLRLSGAAVALLGAAVLVAWHAHWTTLVQVLPGMASMRYSTAVCFVLCGAGGVLLTTRYDRTAVVPAGLLTIVGLLTLLEYATSLHFGIDDLVVKDYLVEVSTYPGRMPPLTAGSFVFLGVGLAVASMQVRRTWQLVAVGALTCIAAVIAMLALLGYVVGIQAAYGWGAHAHMALHTAMAFLMLSLALLRWAWEAARRHNVDLLRWVPITGSATLMAMVAFVSSVSLAQLRSSLDWRTHTYSVLLSADALLGDLADAQRGMRAYAMTGTPVTLGPYQSGVRDAPLQFAQLRVLTQDNPAQQRRIDTLARDFDEVVAYAQQLLHARDSQGLAAAIDLKFTDTGRRIMDRMRTDLQEFGDIERRLLTERDTIAEENLHNTSRLLVLGSVLAAVLLVIAHLMAGREMNRRRRTEVQLHGMTTLQAAILNAANYAIVSCAENGIVTSFNAAAESWLGYTSAEVVGKINPVLWHEAGEVQARAQVLTQQLGRQIASGFDALTAQARMGERDENEWTLIRKDGTRFSVWLTVTALRDMAGGIGGYVAVFADISERKQQEAELRLSEERFRRAFDHAPIGMALVSTTGRWLKVNRALCQMLGYTPAALLATDFQTITHPEDLAMDLARVRQMLTAEIPTYQIEKRYFHANGSVVFVMLSVSLARDRDGKPLHFISQLEDITQRRRMEQMKREFISTVSHELRTPLTSIRGSLGLIEAGVLGALPQKVESLVKIAYQNSERLVRIINDILDIEKIESGRLELRIVCVALPALLQQALEVNQGYGDRHQVRFVLEPASGSEAVLADPDRLMQVMANLLSNAAKFSPPGAEVRVRVRVRAGGSMVRVEVEDRGTGIPEEFRGRIFEKFAQADSSASRRFEGTGLGLSITRELLQAMHGTIGFSDAIGRGTIFYFELPRAAATPQGTPPGSLGDTARRRVLIYDDNSVATPRVLHVEDDIDLSEVISTALNGRAEVMVAPSLAAAEELLSESIFSLIVLDLSLPDGNGLSLLERLPAIAGRSIPVVILSVSEVPRDVQQRVAAALVKSRVSESHIVQTILSLVPQAVC
jgi:PAS domain S-box-containing protein